jgi:hypothetical protein
MGLEGVGRNKLFWARDQRDGVPMGAHQPLRERVHEPPDTERLPIVVWAARFSVYFLFQGGLLLLAYSLFGFDTDPTTFPLGFRLDPIHAGVHFLWGMVGTAIGFFRPRYALHFVLAFAAFYTVLAILGTFTQHHFGMRLGSQVNLFHWTLVGPAWAIGLYGLWRERVSR